MNHAHVGTSFFGWRAVPVVLQSESTECGLACLAMVAGFHGYRTELGILRHRWPSSSRGVTLAHLIGMAKDLRLAPRALRLEPDDFRHLRLPAVLHWNLNHFVVLERALGDHFRIIDPAVGRRRVTKREVSERFSGIALELQPAAGFERRSDPSPLPLRVFFAGAGGLRATILKILLLSVSLQLFVLVAPLFGQIVIDEIVLTADRNLLTVLAPIFLLIVGIQVCLSGVRGWLVTTLGANLQFGWCARLFHHLIRLPLTWYERRHMGDIVSRFHSLRAIESLVAKTVVETIVDGAMAVTTVVVMSIYSTLLTGVVLGAVVLYTAIRLLLFDSLRTASRVSLVLGARAESVFMESVRVILPIKNYGREAIREGNWQNCRAEAINADVRRSRIELIQQMASATLFGAETVAVLWSGALAVLAGELSVGMLVAFIAYKNHFSSRAVSLVDSLLEFRLVGVHLDRLADIALAERDLGAELDSVALRRIGGTVELRNLSFRYGTEPYIINGLNLKVEAGKCIAFTGQSGLGKTTLLKLMMGLVEPTSGQILVDGMDLHRGILGSYRRQIAAVMQDDWLLSGTLADNISFFDPTPDQGRIEASAQLAAIHEDIIRMPMGYLTPVGDMGSTLSGGQRQRICLARALYARPRILFLDEATSHLDAFTEHRVHQAMRDLSITRIVVAHRRETLAVADRVIHLQSRAVAGAARHPVRTGQVGTTS